MKKLLPYCILALLIIAMPVYIHRSYNHRSENPRQQILGKWYFFANDAHVVTFLPGGKLVMPHDRYGAVTASKYEFVGENRIRFQPGAVLLKSDEIYVIRFIDRNTMTLRSKEYGEREYSRDPDFMKKYM